MKIDCSYKNKNGPGQYRSGAENPDEYVWYFNRLNDDEYYNVFIRGKTEKENFAKKAEDDASNDRLSKIFSFSKSEQTGAGKRHGDSIEHLYRRNRKSARPRFLSGW